MTIRGRDAEANRSLCTAIAGVAAPMAGLAQAVSAPLSVRIALLAVAVAAAAAALTLFVFERRAGRSGEGSAGDPRVVPRATNVRKPAKFVNRERELSQLDRLLTRAERGDGPLIGVLGGLPGVGKSAVGQYWMNHVRDRFTDGDLVADFSERRRGAAVDVSGFLADFITKLGPPDAVVPATLHERVERFRTLTLDRKLLVLLDDVSEAAEVNQLRPAGKQSVLIATSYRSLEELYYEGAELIPVEPLLPEPAEDLLVKTAGGFGSAFLENPSETAELIRFCGGLALPLCVCGARVLLGRGERTISSVVAEVADEQRRLSYLAGKGEYAGAAVFGFAYGDLPDDQQLAYRRIGLHPGVDIAPVHAALLTDLPPLEAGRLLTALADTYLLMPLPDGRYRFHDLVRLHARESVVREESQATRDALMLRLVDWYRACLRRADRALIAERLRLAPDEPIDAPYVATFTDRDSAFEWLEAERSNILAVLQTAREREWDDRVWQMVESLWLFHYNRRHYADWIDATEMGIECARRAGHADAEARMRTQLAWAFAELGRYEAAHVQLDSANRAVRKSSNLPLKGSVREFTGSCYLKEGELDRALDAFAEAREVFARSGSDRGVALQDYFIGWALIGKADYAVALETLRRALATMRRVDDQMFVGRLLLRIGQATLRTGDVDGAEAALDEGLAILTKLGLRVEEAESYEQLAAVADARNDDGTAAAHRERAEGIYRALGHPRAGQSGTLATGAGVDVVSI